jgi:PII-like signaling protein
MSGEALKLTIYFGERDRVGDRFLADRILDVFAEHRLAVSVLLRGAEGFGLKQHRRTDRLLTLSEDLPVVAAAVDERARVEEALGEIRDLRFDGLVTLERARLLGDEWSDADFDGAGDEVKLTAYIGRGVRARGRPAHEAFLSLLHQAGAGGGTVLLGVDGTVRGERARARFFSGNVETPVMLISVGARQAALEAARRMASTSRPPVLTVERVQVLKRDGRWIGDLPRVGPKDEHGLNRWVKLTLYSGEQNHFAGRPVHIEAIHRLRRAGARGATALRGTRGYHGDHEPHGDTFFSLRRRVPTLTVVVDEAEAARRWLEVLDEVTPQRGLITSEVVPAHRATAGDSAHGGLRLAGRWT